MVRTLVVALLLLVYAAGANDPSFDGAGSPIVVLAGAHARNGARQPRPADKTALRAALARALGSDERVDIEALAVGCTLVLTSTRLILVREGASYRPSTGVRSWPLDRLLLLRLEQPHRGSSRLTLGRAAAPTSVFLLADQLPAAQALIGEIRRRVHGPAGRA
jgi:hypothetical protein